MPQFPDSIDTPARVAEKTRRKPWAGITVGLIFVAAIASGLTQWFARNHVQDALDAAGRSLMRKDTAAARNDIVWLSRFDADNPRVLYALGMCEELDGNLPEAIRYFEKAVDNAGSDIEVHRETSLRLGRALFKDRQFDRAEPVLVDHLSQYPRSDDARTDLKNMYVSQLRIRESLELLEERRRLYPNDLSVLPDLLITAESRHPSDVASFFEPVNQDRPGQSSVVLALGHAYWQLNDFDRARRHLAEALRLNPDDRRTSLISADFQIDEGNLAEAESLLAGLTPVESDDLYWSVQSRLAEREGEHALALESIDRALVTQPFDQQYLYRKARLLQRLGQKDQADELHAQVARIASALFDRQLIAMILPNTAPTREDCQTIAEMYDVTGRPDLAAGWRVIYHNLERLEEMSPPAPNAQPIDINHIYINASTPD